MKPEQQNYEDIENIAVAPADYLRYMILKRRDVVLWELRHYLAEKARNSTPQVFPLMSAIQTLWYDLETSLREDCLKDKNRFALIKGYVFSDSVDECISGFRKLNDFLYKKQVTKFDTKVKYDYKNVELSNKMQGYT